MTSIIIDTSVSKQFSYSKMSLHRVQSVLAHLHWSMPERLMAQFHYSAELALSVRCRAVPVFGCASTRPSYGAARRGATFSPLFWLDTIVVLSRPTNEAESG